MALDRAPVGCKSIYIHIHIYIYIHNTTITNYTSIYIDLALDRALVGWPVQDIRSLQRFCERAHPHFGAAPHL